MALLHEIQLALLDDETSVGSVLLKLRFLASRLDANILEEWVQHEIEGYPADAQVPDYRIAQVTYTGTFADIARQLNNVSIPRHLIAKFAGQQWVRYAIREGLPVIDSRLRNTSSDGHFAIDSSNLKLILQDKIYEGMDIVEINNRIDIGAFTRVQEAVRAKALDFALKLERQVSAASEISVERKDSAITPTEQEDIKQLAQQVIFGDVTNIHAETGSTVTLNVIEGDTLSLVKALEVAGIPSSDARELAEIADHEAPQGASEPLGTNAKQWLKNKLKAGAAEAWGIGKSAIPGVIAEALKKYYGLT